MVGWLRTPIGEPTRTGVSSIGTPTSSVSHHIGGHHFQRHGGVISCIEAYPDPAVISYFLQLLVISFNCFDGPVIIANRVFPQTWFGSPSAQEWSI